MQGYKVVAITAQELQDDGALAMHFGVLALYLGGDSVGEDDEASVPFSLTIMSLLLSQCAPWTTHQQTSGQAVVRMESEPAGEQQSTWAARRWGRPRWMCRFPTPRPPRLCFVAHTAQVRGLGLGLGIPCHADGCLDDGGRWLPYRPGRRVRSREECCWDSGPSRPSYPAFWLARRKWCRGTSPTLPSPSRSKCHSRGMTLCRNMSPSATTRGRIPAHAGTLHEVRGGRTTRGSSSIAPWSSTRFLSVLRSSSVVPGDRQTSEPGSGRRRQTVRCVVTQGHARAPDNRLLRERARQADELRLRPSPFQMWSAFRPSNVG